MKDVLQNPVVNKKIELIEKGKVMKCNTKMRTVSFRVSEEQWNKILELQKLYKLDDISKTLCHMIEHTHEIEEKEIINVQRLAEEAAKYNRRIV